MRSASLALALVGVLFAGTSVAANGTPGSLAVKAKVAQTCTVTGNTLDFGTYDPLATSNLNASTSVSVQCTKNTNASVQMQEGAHKASGSVCTAPARQMDDGTGAILAYALYSDSGRASVWGCDTTNDVDFTAASSTTPKVLNVYGTVPKAQDVQAGDYTDTVSVTVSF